MPQKSKAKKNLTKLINDQLEIIVNREKITEQKPKPDAKELIKSDRTLDITFGKNLLV
jgi:hypothetical protein